MKQQGYGQRRNRRGRGRGPRWISSLPEATYFRPVGVEIAHQNTIFISIEELEAVRLVDVEDLLQEEAAMYMGVSRKTLWNDLNNARKKIATALIRGWAIRIEGGNYILRNDVEDTR